MSPRSKRRWECASATIGGRLCAAAEQVMSQMKLQSLVITRGRDGMVAFTRRQKPADIPIFGSDQVADVTGAGDTVIATFTAALAAGASAEDAAHLANYAGGIVVMKRGTATASQQELLQALDQAPPARELTDYLGSGPAHGAETSIQEERRSHTNSQSRRIAAAGGGMAPGRRLHHPGQWRLRSAARRPRTLSARGQSNWADA